MGLKIINKTRSEELYLFNLYWDFNQFYILMRHVQCDWIEITLKTIKEKEFSREKEGRLKNFESRKKLHDSLFTM